jgi:hypothetical protein
LRVPSADIDFVTQRDQLATKLLQLVLASETQPENPLRSQALKVRDGEVRLLAI